MNFKEMAFSSFVLKVLLWENKSNKSIKEIVEITRRITQALISMEVFHFLSNLAI